MKVVHINKTDSGSGAAVAAMRLHRSLLRVGVESAFLSQETRRHEENQYVVAEGMRARIENFRNYMEEQITIYLNENEHDLHSNFSLGTTGRDISNLDIVKEADIIHLHWINEGFVSLDGLEKLFALGKPIVWTLHDMWPFTGGCHYAGSCLEFNEHCGFCPFMRKASKSDLSAITFLRKKQLFRRANISVVACSRWLSSMAKSSFLFSHVPVITIPNPIDTDFYAPMDKDECRRELGLPLDKKLLLFGAANINDVRKGMRYLNESLSILHDSFPKLSENIELVVFGNDKHVSEKTFLFKTHLMKFISQPLKLVKMYNAADAFILPSLQDNLPNTVVESMSCGTPVVGFSTGGVPEMIKHNETGFLSEAKNSLSLADGIYNILFFSNKDTRNKVRQSAIAQFAESRVANMYINVYERALRGY